jgi:nucleotide-binding universal stress UspA family protein
MFKHILIPIDSRQLSHQAAMTGLEFAKKLDAQITLVHVLQMPPVYPPQSEHETLEAVREHAKDLLEPWSKIAAKHGVNLKSKIVHDDTHSIASCIVKTADDLECDLILMGTQGREGLERLLVGSVAERVARQANQPVMLLRWTGVAPKQSGFDSILVPVDGSDASRAALWTADELAKQLGASLHFLHVLPDIPLPMSDGLGFGTLTYRPEPWLEAIENEGKAIIKNAKELSTQANVETTVVPATGTRTAQAILKFAKVKNSSLIVIGTHGRRGFDRLLLGSVAEGVLHHADVPVLLVRSKPNET